MQAIMLTVSALVGAYCTVWADNSGGCCLGVVSGFGNCCSLGKGKQASSSDAQSDQHLATEVNISYHAIENLPAAPEAIISTSPRPLEVRLKLQRGHITSSARLQSAAAEAKLLLSLTWPDVD